MLFLYGSNNLMCIWFGEGVLFFIFNTFIVAPGIADIAKCLSITEQYSFFTVILYLYSSYLIPLKLRDDLECFL